jgi:hypothetical protein
MVLDNKSQKRDTKFELPDSQKYKLTLGIDREIVRRAKTQDINISFWTEQLLKIMTFEETEIKTSKAGVLQTWYTFLSEISRMLERYEIDQIVLGELEIHEEGEIVGYDRIYLHSKDRILNVQEEPDGSVFLSREEWEKIAKEYGGKIPPLVFRHAFTTLTEEVIKKHLSRFDSPTEIIGNLLEAMTQSSKINKSKIREMRVALGVLKMMSENGVNNDDNSGTGGK